MTRQEIRRSEELLMELIYEAVASTKPAPHDHSECDSDESHYRICAYNEGYEDALERLWTVTLERKELWRFDNE